MSRLFDRFDTGIGHDLQADDVLDVLRENFAGMGSGENGVNESSLFGNLEHGVEIGGEIGLEILAFAAVAAAETFGDNLAVLVKDGDADFVKHELFVVVSNAIDDFS